MSLKESENEESGSTLTMQIYGRLRQDIIGGVLTPGMRLKIEELRKTYNVGSSPIREALNLLTSFGLVHRLEQRGFQVPPIGFEEFEDLFKVRCWLEERALRESITNGGDDWEEEVMVALFRLTRVSRKVGQGLDTGWEMQHRHFHTTLLSRCGSPKLLEYCTQLYDQHIRYRCSLMLIRPLRDSDGEHAEIAKAVVERQADLAVALLYAHYDKTAACLKELLQERAAEA